MDILEPTVGPILGRTSHAEAHVFLRGDAAPQGGGFGVLQYREGNGPWSAPQVRPLDAAKDHTCVFRLGALQPRGTYAYRAGWTREAPPDGDGAQLSWSGIPPRTFRAAPADDDATTPRSYAVGSCRHLSSPLHPEPDTRGDEIFRSIHALHANGQPFDAFFMLGDQIYADPVRQRAEFLQLYRCAFGGHEHLRGLMAVLPTYMVLDDHEIQENWPAKVDPADKPALEAAALESYCIYQCSHNPEAAEHYWYEFQDGCAEWFVMDTRSQRDLQARRMVDEPQLRALCTFLANGSGRVKLVATTVPIFPDHAFFATDKWQGFTQQRRAIFDCIRQHRVPKVVFVSGDVHCSFVARLQLDAQTAVHTVVCSPFVTWIPFGAIWRSAFWFRLVDAGTDAKPQLLSDGTFWRRNFAHLAVQRDRLRVSFHDRKGQALQQDLEIALGA